MTDLNINFKIEGYLNPDGTMKPVANNQDSTQPITDVEAVNCVLYDTTGEEIEVASGMLKTDGTLQTAFSSTGTFWLGVRGKNSLEVFTDALITLNGTAVSYDFTAQSKGQNEVAVGVYAAYSGDVNGDGVIDADDEEIIDNALNNSFYGVQPTDLNGDGVVDNSDKDFYFANVGRTVAYPIGLPKPR